MNWEEQLKKETVKRVDNITVAVKSLEEAIEYIEKSCELCGRCRITKATCEVARSYRKIIIAQKELETFQSKLENSIR